MTFRFLILITIFSMAVQAGSVISIPASSSITIPEGGYLCAGAINVAESGTFTASNASDVCVTPTGDGDVSLPVQLTYFRAQADLRVAGMRLTWETESETENLGFLIERRPSQNGTWSEIASFGNYPELEGQGNSTVKNLYSFIDKTLESAQFYDYRLGDVSYSGEVSYHLQPVVGVCVEKLIPDHYFLSQNYPNPFNPSTTIAYGLAQDGDVSITVYDALGHEVALLLDARQDAGYYNLTWQGMTNEGRLVGTGLYLARIETTSFVKVIKMVYLQ